MSDDLDVLGLLRKYENTDKLKKQAADEIERLREMVNSMSQAQDGWGRVPRLEAEIEHLRTLGDALAATGGQHGFDEALDNWKEMRGE